MAINTTKSVFEFGNEYICSNFFDVDTQSSGVDVSLDGKHIGEIVGISIPDDIDDVEENAEFYSEVIEWIIENKK